MRSSDHPVRFLLPVLLLLAWPVGADEPAVHVPGGGRPAVLDQLGPLDDLQAIAFSPDGRRAAVARLSPSKSDHSEIRLYTAEGEPHPPIPVAGEVRDLLFDLDGELVYGVLHKRAKRREGDTTLILVPWGATKARRAMRLPPSAGGLDHWISESSLLIAGRDEVRTVRLPDMRSGPLFRVLGENLSVASLGGSSLVLVGQLDAILLIDLDDPPGEDAMPVRSSTSTADAVISLAAASDGGHALARLADGSVLDVRFDPLRTIAAGSAEAVAALEKQPVDPPIDVPPLPAPAASIEPAAIAAAPAVIAATTEPTRATPEPESEPESEPEPEPEPEPERSSQEPPPVTQTDPVEADPAAERPTIAPATATVAAAPSAETEAETENKPQASPEPPAETASEPSPDDPQLQGRIVGPAVSLVVEVVLLGPNNILREAARVRPDGQGRWEIDGLAPGRYRIQLDGGGSRVLLSEPGYVLIEIVRDKKHVAQELNVLRAL